ncbi:unnamed protein product [Rotaria socialis]|uniref:Reverse transcriptase domain-containing protein n=1 Tax=Rotaria socialis TaxID=392032 RepID=A0A820Y8D2_9BILA|nr:unnamed protein product [Rotaria socialis]CAF4539144.1 unnamed protein product [Rotaria socialis]CAF4583283.1 unnamed protein product [Rotaria socialis]
MKIIFDSGSTKSFINQIALKRTQHLPIHFNKQHYIMADGCTTFEVIGTVRIFIELNYIKTNIIVGVVNSLCINCILGMDYITKYKVNINNKRKQVQVYTASQKITIPMKDQSEKIRIICRIVTPLSSNNISTALDPYTNDKFDNDKSILLSPSGEQHFNSLGTHIKCQQQLAELKAVLIKHSSLFDTSKTTIAETSTPHVICTGDNPPTTSRSYGVPKFRQYDFRHWRKSTVLSPIHSIPHLTFANTFGGTSPIGERPLYFRQHIRWNFAIGECLIGESLIGESLIGEHTATRSYPQTIDKQNATFDIIQQMLKHKQIRASHSQYSAPVLLIKKHDGSYRFILDYRKLNNITIQDNYPLPNLEQAIQIVGGHQYYTKLDLRSGYFQIPIREEDKHKTAFITVHELYEFNVLAQSLKNRPPSFQRIMSNLLLPCKKFCLVFLDDILIYSDSFAQHLDHLNQVLAILNKYNFQLNPQKYEVAKTSIDYLGHTISNQGIKLLQERIDKILAIPQPTTLNQANAFIGAIGWVGG